MVNADRLFALYLLHLQAEHSFARKSYEGRLAILDDKLRAVVNAQALAWARESLAVFEAGSEVADG